MVFRHLPIASLLAELMVASASSNFGTTSPAEDGRLLGGCKEVWINYCRDYTDNCQNHCATNPAHDSCCAVTQLLAQTVTVTVAPRSFLARQPPETGSPDGTLSKDAWLVTIVLGLVIGCVMAMMVAFLLAWSCIRKENAKVSPSHHSSTGIPTIHIDPSKLDISSVPWVGAPSDASTASPRPSIVSSSAGSTSDGRTTSPRDSSLGMASQASPRQGLPCYRGLMPPPLDANILLSQARSQYARHNREARSRSAPPCPSALPSRNMEEAV